MQLRISWQLLAATLIFLVGICIIGRTLVSSYQSYQAPLPGSVAVDTASSPLAQTEATMVLPTAQTTPSPSATPTAPPASPTASPPRATPTLSPTSTITPTVEPTLAPPTATPFIPPTPTATPAPLPIALAEQGFSQLPEVLSYAFVLNNPNPDLAVQQTRFQVAAYDASGIVVKTASGEITLIGPGQQAAVAGTLEIPANFQISRFEVLLREGLFIRSSPPPLFLIENLALVPGENPIITGILRNPFERDLEEVPLVGIVYDDSGAIIGGGNGSVLFLPALGQVPVEVPITTAGTPARLTIFPLLSDLALLSTP
jgi:hypothetical protein